MRLAMQMPRVMMLAAAALFAPSGWADIITYYHNDLLGSPRVATDAARQVVWAETYTPHGERLNGQRVANKIWYTSRHQDDDTGLVYMGARYYDPLTGRFMGVDSKHFQASNIHSFNRYAYAYSNPYKYIDPDGRMGQVAAIEGAAIVGLAIFYSQPKEVRERQLRSLAAGISAIGGLIFNSGSEEKQGSQGAPKPPDPASGNEADPADKSGELTKAGRAQQKHGDREGSAFDPASGTPADKNEQGRRTLEGIVTSPDRTDERNRIGGTDVRESPNGRGARFDKNGRFVGFLEPPS